MKISIEDHNDYLIQLQLEIRLIIERSTEEERKLLVDAVINPASSAECIYGRMLGHCDSPRYREITEGMFFSIIGYKWIHRQDDHMAGFTPLEVALIANETEPILINELRDYIVQERVPKIEELHRIVENISICKQA